jgi:hypothetical protein
LTFLDSDKSARFTHPVTGECVSPLPGFSVVLTSNIESPDFLDPALRDRFPVSVNIDSAHPDGLSVMQDDSLKAAASVLIGTDVRYSLRSFYAMEALTSKVGSQRAASLVFGPKAEALLDALAIEGVAS